MIPQDLSDIEVRLDIRLPAEYWDAMLAEEGIVERGVFNDAAEIIDTNLKLRELSWLGRPLNRVHFVFGKDARNCELMLDLEVPGFPVLAADHEGRSAKVIAWSFAGWMRGE